MSAICHVFDRSAGWEQRLAVGQLLDRLSAKEHPVTLAAIDPAALHGLNGVSAKITLVGHASDSAFPWLGPFLTAPTLGRLVARRGAKLIHAWGVDAAWAAQMSLRGRQVDGAALCVELFDPALTRSQLKKLRTIAEAPRCGVICSSQTVRRRLVEGGVAADRCVTIRPGVDFGLLSKWRRGDVRARLAVTPKDRLILLPEPVGRQHKFLDAFFAGAILHQLQGNVRVVLAGRSREAARIARFAQGLPTKGVLLALQDGVPFEQILAVSDVLIVAARGDMATTSIAWAMAAGVSVIASAEYATAELIAHKVNGLLFKAAQGRSMAMPICKLLRDDALVQKTKEAARGQAYEIFSIRRYVDQHSRFYANILQGGELSEGINDPAFSG